MLWDCLARSWHSCLPSFFRNVDVFNGSGHVIVSLFYEEMISALGNKLGESETTVKGPEVVGSVRVSA